MRRFRGDETIAKALSLPTLAQRVLIALNQPPACAALPLRAEDLGAA